MNCIALMYSGNYVLNICRQLERKGYVFEVISTPCQLAKEGCGYCLKFPEEYKDIVLNEGIINRQPIREIYRIIPLFSKNKYEKIY